jgi:hypothetical protein
MRYLLLLACALSFRLQAQELFTMTEPASNMAARSLSVRSSQSLMKNIYNQQYSFHSIPEVMLGINKEVMVHLQVFTSNAKETYAFEGAGFYAKYRFLSIDDVHSHFRMANFGRFSFNNSELHQEEIETFGHNTGFEFGLVATQLLHKTAINLTSSYEKALNNGKQYLFPEAYSNQAINYTLSIGQLVYPKKYTSYKQTNVNLMLELLGQSLLESNKNYIDIVPVVQFIIHSRARIDIAYRRSIYNNMLRSAPNGLMLKLEYNFYGVWGNKK